MDKAISDFLASAPTDEMDAKAQRLITVLYACASLYKRAWAARHVPAMSRCHMGALTAAYAIAVISAEKDYPFAAEVHPRMTEMVAMMKRVKEEAKLVLLESNTEQAEAALVTTMSQLDATDDVNGICYGEVIPLFWAEQKSIGAS